MRRVREVLVAQITDRLVEAWETDGNGVVDVGLHYVQWARYVGGLQVECVSNAFLEGDDRLGFVQRRLLDQLGFSRPEGEWPNYYARFEAIDDLPRAAELVVRVIEGVLDDAALERQLPERGNVCVVVPVGKCDQNAVLAVVEPMLSACEVRRPTTLINAYFDERWAGPDLTDWLEDAVGEPAVLSTSAPDGANLGALLRWAADVAQACTMLRDRGVHVLVLGPYFLPSETWLYSGLVGGIADGFVAVVDEHGARLCRDDLDVLFSTRVEHRVVAGYGSEPVKLAGATDVCAPPELGAPFDLAMALPLGLRELRGGF